MPLFDSRARSSGVNMPLSPTTMRSAGTSRASRSQVASVVSKVFRLRLLMPISFDFRRSARCEFLLVVHFDKRIHAERHRRRFKLGGAGVVDRGHDDQDAIGAVGARFRHLVGVVHEILAQGRQRRCRARLAQVLEAALKRGRVGQH